MKFRGFAREALSTVSGDYTFAVVCSRPFAVSSSWASSIRFKETS